MKWLRLRLRTLIVGVVPLCAIVVWIVGRPPFCEVHGAFMSRLTVPISYGGVDLFDHYESRYTGARRVSFPHCDDNLRGVALSDLNAPAA
jgi:hypothetical protein